ncbi:MAG: glycosyltransferase family 2 protein [Chloroflexi bacterium]|nr:glycosyltransferase family 2 protein [Chloroflexota bacterium]
MAEAPYLSIIIPAYNEESRLAETLDEIAAFLARQDYAAEVLVVENGSRDRTFAIARAYAETHPGFSALHRGQPGKGGAVRAGMLAARGRYRFMCDADRSMSIADLPRFLPPNHSAPIVIGSREAPGAVRYNEPQFRHLGGRGINWMIRVLALPGLQDTQCGYKLFRADAAEDLFSDQTLTGWSFDAEILFLARRRGYAIAEQPIPWNFAAESHVRPIPDALRLFRDLLVIRLNALRGRYGPKKV